MGTLTLTQQLSTLIAHKEIGANDLESSALFLLDAIANIVAGQNSPQGKKLINWARFIAPKNDLSQLDDGRKVLLLGSLCHILEVDDLHRASVVHPGCVVAPVAVVLGSSMSGDVVLKSFLRGVEATTRLGMSVGPQHYKVWHNTATCGPFGSAVCAGDLLGLSHEQTVHALGNAGSQAAGLWAFLKTGAETKHLHAGRGAEAGLVAAQLAAQGFTGAPDILESSSGFYAGTCTNPPIENLLSRPDAPWQIHETSIKPWPSCRHTHPAIELALALCPSATDVDWSLDDINSIQARTYQATLDLCDQPIPTSTYTAKFSLQHCIAVALSKGLVDLDCFGDKARQQAADLRALISVRISDDQQAAYPKQWGAKIVIELKDGRTIEKVTNSAFGDPDAPLSIEQMKTKAQGLFDHAGFKGGPALVAQILDMPNGGPCPDIFSLINT